MTFRYVACLMLLMPLASFASESIDVTCSSKPYKVSILINTGHVLAYTLERYGKTIGEAESIRWAETWGLMEYKHKVDLKNKGVNLYVKDEKNSVTMHLISSKEKARLVIDDDIYIWKRKARLRINNQVYQVNCEWISLY